jgi:hypothetical protein
MRGTPSRARGRGGPRECARPLQPRLLPEPAGAVRRRAAGDQARPRARSVLPAAALRADGGPPVRGIGDPRRGGSLGRCRRRVPGPEFQLDTTVLDQVFRPSSPRKRHREPAPAEEDPFALARDLLDKGMLEAATAEVSQVIRRRWRCGGGHRAAGPYFRAPGTARRGPRALPRGAHRSAGRRRSPGRARGGA